MSVVIVDFSLTQMLYVVFCLYPVAVRVDDFVLSIFIHLSSTPFVSPVAWFANAGAVFVFDIAYPITPVSSATSNVILFVVALTFVIVGAVTSLIAVPVSEVISPPSLFTCPVSSSFFTAVPVPSSACSRLP